MGGIRNLPKESGHQKLTKGGCPNGKNQRASLDCYNNFLNSCEEKQIIARQNKLTMIQLNKLNLELH